ncbi:hypothetical protein [Hyalangium gracile]|uniref:hypothetical protein n=1 Tax=Hyalangium gracile TaxID=394092 RepID=UPI001CCFE66A|nr:hypothetical protein [Hyalangium gracile]
MKSKLIAASVFLMGLGIGGAAAAASRGAPEAEAPRITEEMARCVYQCELAGGSRTVCWNCCVRNICID